MLQAYFYLFDWQVLGKSAKPIPVMILGVLVAKKRYPIQKYMFVLLIVIGVAMFIFKDSKSGKVQEDQTLGWGGILLVSNVLVNPLPAKTKYNPYNADIFVLTL